MSLLGNLLIRLTADTAEATSDVGKAAHQIEREMEAMATRAAIAGKVVGDVLGQVAGAFLRASAEALAMGDTLAKASQRTNFTVERLSELAFAGELADVSVQQLTTGLGMFNKVLADAGKEGSKASELFKALGVDITQGPQVAFEQFTKAINSLPDGEQKVAAMRIAFGRAGDALLPMIAGLDDATEKARALGLVMSEQAARDAERFNDAVTVLQASTRSLALDAMQSLAGWLANVAEGMAKARVNGNLFKNTLLETGMLWASLWGGMAEKIGMKNVADAMESEFRRLQKLQQEMNSGAGSDADSQAGGFYGPNVNRDALARATAGIKDKAGKAKRDDNLLGRQLQEDMDAWAKIMSEAAAATDKYNQTVRDREKAEVSAEIAAQVARAESIVQMQEILDQQTRMAHGWDANGNKIVESSKKAKDIGRELGLTFTSAFEDAVVSGKKLSEVMRGLAQDIARVIMRKSVTEPLGAAISTGLGKIFEGISFAGGGFTGPGARSGGLDGQGGFMAMLHPQETVVDHTRGGMGSGGVTVVQNIHIDSRTDRAGILQAMSAAKDQAKAEIMASLNRGGEFASATGRA